MNHRPSALLAVSLLCGFAVAALGAGPAVYVPLPVGDLIQNVETTKLDIGEPKLLFDHDRHTLIRTPSINPAFVRFELKTPVTCELIRIIVIDTQHTWSLAVADNADDLRGKTGSYRVLAKDRVSPSATIELPLEKAETFRAVELNVLRQGGDDYVHISEIQFCRPGTIEKIAVQRVIDRRAADAPQGLADVTGPIEVPEQTVVWFKAKALAGGVPLDIDEQLQWRAEGPGLAPYGREKGMFVVTAPGEQRLVAKSGDFEQTLTIVGTERKLRNRQPDVEIAYIERLPRIDFDGQNGGWPETGAPVTWRGHLYNWGTQPVRVKYTWELDGRAVADGEVELPPGPPGNEFTPVELPWQWAPARHDLKLSIAPVQPLDEVITANNTLTIQTNAITVGFWVEQSLWDFHHEHQHELPLRDANSYAGWAQRMMRFWNRMFSDAVYPEYPDGITERVRLDRLVIVPDFALPLAGGLPSNNPDNRDKTIDVVWGMESVDLTPGCTVKADHWWSPERAIKALNEGLVEKKKQDPPFWCGLGYIHEMGHARYLIDAYGFNVHSGIGEDLAKRNLRVTDEHGPILGRYMPLKDDIQHRAVSGAKPRGGGSAACGGAVQSQPLEAGVPHVARDGCNRPTAARGRTHPQHRPVSRADNPHDGLRERGGAL